MKVGKNIILSLHLVWIICVVHSSVYSRNLLENNPRILASDSLGKNTYENPANYATRTTDYVPNEIIVKFNEKAASNLEEGLRNNKPLEQISLGDSLDKLKQRFHIQKVIPVFKNFKRQLPQLRRLAQKDKGQLSKTESRLRNRMRRSPSNIMIPELDRIYILETEVSDNQKLEQVVDAYSRNPQVEYAELNYIVRIDVEPNDTYFAVQWPLHNIGQMYPANGKYNNPPGTPDADIDAPEAWDIQTGSGDIIVAVVDTGVDYNHRDIDDNMWTDSNGYHGHDFVNDDNYPSDDNGHGTHCAGIIAAEGNNGLDITGVCWNVKIMALKFLDQTGSGTYADAAEAFYYAVNNGADIISNSWGKSEYSQTMQEAIDYAYSQGVLIVASAGNDNQFYFPHYPAAMENVISVAATNSNDEKGPISNYGDWIDISAPGIDILSLRAGGTSMGKPYDSYTTIASGTSMACPYVSGVIALLLSQYPDISSEEISARLLNCTDDISGVNPNYKGLLGRGRLNAYKALRFNSEAIVTLDREKYSCSGSIKIQVSDFDIRGTGLQAVTVTTNGGDSETIVLAQEPNHSWIFAGSIITSLGAVVSGNGTLEVSPGQIITAAYLDPNYGGFGQYIIEKTAYIDCKAPNIFNVHTYNVTSSGARIRFRTDEAATAAVKCGPNCSGPYCIVSEDSTPAKAHNVYLPNLMSETQYFFVIEANDLAGNHRMDDNKGRCYSFITGPQPAGLRVTEEYPTIQEAINAATNGQTIWVADGTYTGNGNRDIKFKGKAITLRSENGPENCIIDCRANPSDNHYGFYFSYGEDSNSVVDGFTITRAYNSSTATNGGAGIVCDRDYDGPGQGKGGCHPSILNCIITGNTALVGGGIACINSSPIINNCSIIHNEATHDSGGGIYAHDRSSPTITNCIISFNKAKYKGAGIYCLGGSPIINHCLINCNRASIDCGGGIAAWTNSNPAITNCTLNGNSADNEGAGIITGSNVSNTIKNCILWDNGTNEFSIGGDIPGHPVIEYSNIKGGWSGRGNINADPLFADPINGDYHLKSQKGRWCPSDMCWIKDEISSPCIDAGHPDSEFTDELWPNGRRINMGAYGGTTEASMSNSAVGNMADLNLDDAVDFLDLKDFTEGWLTYQAPVACDLDRDGDIDLYDYAILAQNWLWEE